MKTKYILSLVLFLSFSFLSVNAQERRGEGKKEFNMEKIKETQAAFFVKELNLTDAESKAFIPLLNEFTDKKFEINRATRAEAAVLRKKDTKTDADYQKVIDMFLDSKIKEAQLQKEYYQKFRKALPAEKLYKLQRVEMKFMQRALENRTEKSGSSSDKK